jgi:hypothetical protein
MVQMGWSLFAAALCGAALSGCGGGGGGGDDDEAGIVVTPDGRVLAGSEPIQPADFVGRTFPLLFASAEDGAAQATTTTGQGSVEVVDADTIIITLPGRPARTFDRISSTEYSNAFGDVRTFEGNGVSEYFYQTGGAPGAALIGAYGFETPVGARPVTARYGARSASVVFYAPDGSPGWVGLGGPGTVDLIATFDGSGGRIEGTLIDASQFVDFLEDGTADDVFSLRTTLDGVINRGGFGGTVNGTASVAIAGSVGPQDLGLSLANSSVDGKFFGTEADVVSGSYAADATITPPGGPSEGGKLSGFFDATQ